MDDVAIKVENVSKMFRLPHEKNTSIKSAVINFYKQKRSFEKQEALKNVSLEVRRGEFFGIVGRNGSGKSTLLKLLAGIYTPSNGSIQINGKLTPFIELGVGFNPELTGRENVYLNGALLGFNRKEMRQMYKDIVDFAELERFMDQKLKNYSSGMQVRLAFSIAIRAKSDILVLDEVLAVGDSNFQKKCFEVFTDFKKQKRTIILVTHDMSSVEEYCDRAMIINDGDVILTGDTNKVIKKYNEINTEASIKASTSTGYHAGQSNRKKVARIKKCNMGTANDPKYIFSPKEKISIRIQAEVNKDVDELISGIIIHDQLNRPLFATNTKAKGQTIEDCHRGDIVNIEFTLENVLSDGTYYITPSLASQGGKVIYDTLEEPLQFKTTGWPYPAYLLQPEHNIKITKEGQ